MRRIHPIERDILVLIYFICSDHVSCESSITPRYFFVSTHCKFLPLNLIKGRLFFDFLFDPKDITIVF